MLRVTWAACYDADSDSAGLGWGLRLCISNSVLGDVLVASRGLYMGSKERAFMRYVCSLVLCQCVLETSWQVFL
jgi:hypothetical protein